MGLQLKPSLSIITIISVCGVPAWSLAQAIAPATSTANGATTSTGQPTANSQAEKPLPIMGPTPLTCQNTGFDAVTGESWCIDASGNRIADPTAATQPTNGTSSRTNGTNVGRSSNPQFNSGRSRSTTGSNSPTTNAPNAITPNTTVNSCTNFWFDASTGKSGCLTPMGSSPAATTSPTASPATTTGTVTSPGSSTAAKPNPAAKTCLSNSIDAKTGQLTCLTSPNDLLEAVPSTSQTPTNALSAPKPTDLSAYPPVFAVGGSIADQRYMGELINAIAKTDEPLKRAFYDIAQSIPDYFVSRAKLTCQVLEEGKSWQEARKLRDEALNLGSAGQTMPAQFGTTESALTDQLAVKHYCPQFAPKQK